MAATLLVHAGCTGTRDKLDPILLDQEDAAQLAVQALEADQPDDRRMAVNRLGRSKFVGDDEIIRTLGVIARNDLSVSVRLAAIVALGRADTAEACATCTLLLPDGDASTKHFSPEDVRAELLISLEDCAARDLLTAQQVQYIGDMAIWLLQNDVSGRVRTAAARLLGYYPHRDALQALIHALEHRDFGVCHAAELALQRLTGRSFDHDPQAWRAYVASADDPFAEPVVPAGPRGGLASWFDWFSPDE
jgi:HEAT repeat protein